MTRIFIVLLIFTSSLVADVKSITGQIKFDTQMDNQAEMTLNSAGLGIGVTPSTNLHVNGNAIVTEQVFVGGSSGSSNLNVNGTIGFGFQTVNSSTTLSGNSIVLADTSSGNIVLSLPEANSYEGRSYTIKKTSTLNSLFIRDGGFIDDYSDVSLSVNNMGSLTVISSSGNWHILNISDNGNMISTDNLVGWWKLDESSGLTAGDSSSQAADKTLIGTGFDFSAASTSDAAINRALQFNGSGNYINLGTVLNTPQEFTFSLWIRFNGARVSAADGILGQSNNPRLTYGLNSQKFNFFFTRDNANNAAVSSKDDVILYQWYHVAVGASTRDMNNQFVELYLNGILDNSRSWSSAGGNFIMPSGDLYLNKRDSKHTLNADIDDVRIYNKYLGPSEIMELSRTGEYE